MRAHRKAMACALVVVEVDRPAGLAYAFLELAHSFDRRLFVPRAVKDQRRDRNLLCKAVGLQPRPCAFGADRESMETHDQAKSAMRGWRHQRMHAAAADPEDR